MISALTKYSHNRFEFRRNWPFVGQWTEGVVDLESRTRYFKTSKDEQPLLKLKHVWKYFEARQLRLFVRVLASVLAFEKGENFPNVQKGAFAYEFEMYL